MEFKKFKEELQKHFNKMVEMGADILFEVGADKDEMWNLYIESFPEGTNNIFRVKRKYDCSHCRHFIKNMGNVVAIKDNKVISIWDFDAGSETFNTVREVLSKYIHSKVINNIFVRDSKNMVVNTNLEKTETGVIEWSHLYVELPNNLVKSNSEIGTYLGTWRSIKEVFQRSLEEISLDSIEVVLELIAQNSLYRGTEYKAVLESFLKYKKEYMLLNKEEEKNNYSWKTAVIAGQVVGKIRNHAIGTLLVNLSENMDLEIAVKKYESIVAPTNYKRPKALFTKKMLEEAQKTVTDLGYLNSLGRRYAKADDITVNNILFTNKDTAKRVEGAGNIFDQMAAEVPISPKAFNKVEEITIENFIKDVLPTANEIEVMLENKHKKNMVSLIAPEVKDSKTMFKWNNNFSWAYAGNLADSDIKENVKNAGGKIDGDLRFSIQWNDGDIYDGNDLDAHCKEPGGYEIFFRNKRRFSPNRGMLDTDIITPRGNVAAVENIVYEDRNKMKEGEYKFIVNCYSNGGGKGGFRAEIEFDGQIYSYEYNKVLRSGENVLVATIKYSKKDGFSFVESLDSTFISKDIWGVKTNVFTPVSIVMNSPNYWDDQSGIGNKHYFFMLKDCINPEEPNGFYNEFLKPELEQHKRVFMALGSKMSVKDTEDQLSGVGFSSTIRNELTVKVKGATERILKIKF